jgi:hypothetical protein
VQALASLTFCANTDIIPDIPNPNKTMYFNAVCEARVTAASSGTLQECQYSTHSILTPTSSDLLPQTQGGVVPDVLKVEVGDLLEILALDALWWVARTKSEPIMIGCEQSLFVNPSSLLTTHQ